MPSFLFDNNTTPGAAAILRRAGITAVHIKEIGRDTMPDDAIVRLAVERGDVIVTYDNDFPEMLAYAKASRPSLILLREGAPTRPKELAAFLTALSDEILQALDIGAIASFDGRKVRIRRLPIG